MEMQVCNIRPNIHVYKHALITCMCMQIYGKHLNVHMGKFVLLLLNAKVGSFLLSYAEMPSVLVSAFLLIHT